MKRDLENITAKLRPITDGFVHHRRVIFFLCFLCVYTFLVIRINSLTSREPEPAALNDKLQTVKRVRIDQDSIDRILQLEEQNIEVKGLFQQARDNPFAE